MSLGKLNQPVQRAGVLDTVRSTGLDVFVNHGLPWMGKKLLKWVDIIQVKQWEILNCRKKPLIQPVIRNVGANFWINYIQKYVLKRIIKLIEKTLMDVVLIFIKWLEISQKQKLDSLRKLQMRSTVDETWASYLRRARQANAFDNQQC